MFEVGFTEMILIVGLALIVLGPQKLPGLVRKVGRWAGRARSMARQLQMQLDHEVTLEEISKTRPMQPSTAARAETTPSDPSPNPAAARDDHAMGTIDDFPAAEPAIHATAGTDTARPVDLSKPLQ